MWEKNKLIIILLLVHILTVLGLLTLRIVLGQDYHETMLTFDGYYDLAKSFVNGGALTRPAHGPVVPLILSPLFLFPESIHPFIRLITTFLFSYGTIYILFEITRNHLDKKQFFIGSLFFLLNPVFFHWTFKGAPEIYLCFFLGLFILNMIKFYKFSKLKNLLFAIAAFSIGFFIKPVFIFIPPVLFLTGLLLVKSKKIARVSVLLLMVGIISYLGYNISTGKQLNSSSSTGETKYYGRGTLLIKESFWVDYVIKTGQFHKGTLMEYETPNNIHTEYSFGGSIYDLYEKTSNEWIEAFYKKFPGRGTLFMNLYFIYDKPLLVFQKLVLSPLFFFSMSARPAETFFKLFLSLFAIILSVAGLMSIFKENQSKSEIIIILSILLGFTLLYFALHSINRYSYPILPYLYIWGGVIILKIKKLDDYLTRKKIFLE